MDPPSPSLSPSPPDVLSKSDVFSWITDHTLGSGGSREGAFLKAVAEGNVHRLKNMVNRMDEKDRAKLADMNIDGIGLIQIAANLGKIEVIRYLVEELGFDVNVGCLCGESSCLPIILLGSGKGTGCMQNVCHLCPAPGERVNKKTWLCLLPADDEAKKMTRISRCYSFGLCPIVWRS